MPEPGCCQLTCHSLHAAPGLAGWGEAGAGEPVWPQSSGRGSEQVGSCLSQAPCSALPGGVWLWKVQGTSSLACIFPPPHDFHGGLCSRVGGEVVLNWKHSVGGSTGLWGWGRPAHLQPQPA